MPIRDAIATDAAVVLALNHASVEETSRLDPSGLESLAAMATYFRVVTPSDGQPGDIEGFLLALREDAEYDNANFRWFRQRYPRFLYIDRIVVRADCRGRGVGSRLYTDVERFARAARIEPLTCEVNLRPANAASLEFHDRRGFQEVGTQTVAAGAKLVSLRAKRLVESVTPTVTGSR